MSKWYSKGLSFSCTGCGGCCTGAPGFVWVSEEEILKMAETLSLSLKEFSFKYLRKVGDRFSLKENLPHHDCIFLKEKRCLVYEVRPKQCRTFPWWQQNLTSEEAWQEAAKSCEGIHPEGRHYRKEEIDEALHC